MKRSAITGRATILATGSYVPQRIVTNDEIARCAPTTDRWVRENLGINERRIASDGQVTSDLASLAAMRALENAQLAAEDVDLIIVATATPDRLAPSTACILQEKIGAHRAAAFDIAAVCSGFLYALTLARSLVEAGHHRYVLVVGADTFSRITDWTRRDAVFFGDGAGAVIVGPCADGGIIHARLFADGRGQSAFTVPAGGSELPAHDCDRGDTRCFFQMDTKAVFETATTVLPEAISQVLVETGFSVEDVNLIVPHQPGIRILKRTAEALGVPLERIAMNMDRYANTAGATIPLLLDEVHAAGRVKSGDLVLLAAVGSGWTWGALLLRWNTSQD